MASGFFALLDDVAALMDDVAVLSKVTTKKTAGILGDDLAVNAEKASGFTASRELPVLWAITKGSFLNKLIILPIAFLLSAFLPKVITIILVLGGIYLAYEGAEKVYAYLWPHTKKHQKQTKKTQHISNTEVVEQEQAKIKSAIVTDFILSVEIVIIALGTVLNEVLLVQIMVVSVVAIIATVGVYGVVAVIVRMDDFGLKLVKTSAGRGFRFKIGGALVTALPYVIKALSVIGTLALLLVSGGIFVHNIPELHAVMVAWPALVKEFVVGLIVGLVAVMLWNVSAWLIEKIGN
ncbi:DUF808 domain-containing protein [Bizionia sediminis]|uniref:DUF808 domain-containing protein n=1 Tax=Bizionia sediminis TaxID=1737064 RepID=A0ABW5KR97_9FLAO